MDTEPITVAGAKKLQDELNDLVNNKRQKVIQAIAEAREHGDLKENAEYHAAKEEQGHIEGRIQEIQLMLSNAEIIDLDNIPKTQKTVVFGATVELSDLDDESKTKFQIVGDDEAATLGIAHTGAERGSTLSTVLCGNVRPSALMCAESG